MPKQIGDIPGLLVWSEKNNRHEARATAFTAKPFSNLYERKGVPIMRPQLSKVQASAVMATPAGRTVMVAFVDIGKRSGFKFCEFHGRTIAVVGCIHQLDDSYSIGG